MSIASGWSSFISCHPGTFLLSSMLNLKPEFLTNDYFNIEWLLSQSTVPMTPVLICLFIFELQDGSQGFNHVIMTAPAAFNKLPHFIPVTDTCFSWRSHTGFHGVNKTLFIDLCFLSSSSFSGVCFQDAHQILIQMNLG